MRVDERCRNPHVEQRHHANESEERERALQEQIGERESIVLIQNGEHQRQRRVMPDELDQPRVLIWRTGRATEVQRGHRECRQRDRRDASLKSRLAALGYRQRREQHGIRGRQQQQTVRRVKRAIARRNGVCGAGDSAPDVREAENPASASLGSPKCRVHDDGGQKSQRRVGNCSDPGQRVVQTEVAHSVDEHGADVPDHAKGRGCQGNSFGRPPLARRDHVGQAPARHRAQHCIQHNAGRETNQVNQRGQVASIHRKGSGRVLPGV